MRELRIELPDHEERRMAINTIAIIAEKYGLEYDALKFPKLKVIDETTGEIIFESSCMVKCYVSGNDSDVKNFLSEIKSLIDER